MIRQGWVRSVVAATAMLAASALTPRDVEAQDLVAEATAYLDRGDYGRALPAALDAIEQVALDPERTASGTATVISHFSDLYWQAGAWMEADRFYTQAIARLETALGANHLCLTQLLSYASAVESVMGRYDDAVSHYERARSILLAEAGPDDPRLGMIAYNLAAALEDTGRWRDAEDYYGAALDNWTRSLDGRDTRLREVRESLDRLAARRVSADAGFDVVEEQDEQTVAGISDKGDFGIHLSSVRKSPDVDPRDEWQRLKALYPKVLNGLTMRLSTADLGNRQGVFYRIVAGPLSRDEAKRKCGQLAERDAWCQPVRTEVTRTGAAGTGGPHPG